MSFEKGITNFFNHVLSLPGDRFAYLKLLHFRPQMDLDLWDTLHMADVRSRYSLYMDGILDSEYWTFKTCGFDAKEFGFPEMTLKNMILLKYVFEWTFYKLATVYEDALREQAIKNATELAPNDIRYNYLRRLTTQQILDALPAKRRTAIHNLAVADCVDTILRNYPTSSGIVRYVVEDPTGELRTFEFNFYKINRRSYIHQEIESLLSETEEISENGVDWWFCVANHPEIVTERALSAVRDMFA